MPRAPDDKDSAHAAPGGDAAAAPADAMRPHADSMAARRAAVAGLRQAACEAAGLLEDSHLAEEEHVTRLGFALKVGCIACMAMHGACIARTCAQTQIGVGSCHATGKHAG